MRLLLAATLLCLATLPTVAPTAAAAHAGPCWHEYAEAALTGDPGVIEGTVEGCLDRLLTPLCRVLDPCPLP